MNQDQVFTKVHADVIQNLFTSAKSGWKSEREFHDFIELNIERVSEEIICLPYESHRSEWYLSDFKGFGTNSPRVDLMIKAVDGTRHAIECKFPRHSFSELSRSMSQLLSYAVLAEAKGFPLASLWIFTTVYDDILRMTIERYKLPIRVVVFSRSQHAVLLENVNGE